MAKFVIRPATAGDCSDILRLIKVAGSAGSSRGGVGVLVPRRSPFLRLSTHSPGQAAPLPTKLWERIPAPLTPFPRAVRAGASLNFLLLLLFLICLNPGIG